MDKPLVSMYSGILICILGTILNLPIVMFSGFALAAISSVWCELTF